MSRFFVSTTEIMDLKLLETIIGEHRATSIPKYQQLYSMYKGEHDILNRTMSDHLKPNNKLVNNYFKQIVDDVIGYFLGKPIVVSLYSDKLQDELDTIFKQNDIDDLFMEVGKESSIKGVSAIMVYQDELSQTQIQKINAEDIIFVYDTSVNKQLLYAIRLYTRQDLRTGKSITDIEVYSRYNITYYTEIDGKYVQDYSRIPTPHIFGEVPFVEIINNEEFMGDFENVITLVDDYNKVFSDQSNEHEAFRNAYLILKNMIIDDEAISKLKEHGVLEVGEDGDAKFLTKQSQISAVDSHLNRLEENIYKFTQIPNLSDEKFAGNLSGIAIEFKLFSMENKCITKERKFTKAIKRLLRLLSNPLFVKTNERIDITTTQVQFTRNLPTNITELVDTVSKLNGLVDMETLLSILPFIDNPTLIIEKLKAEQDTYMSDMEKYAQNEQNSTLEPNNE